MDMWSSLEAESSRVLPSSSESDTLHSVSRSVEDRILQPAPLLPLSTSSPKRRSARPARSSLNQVALADESTFRTR